MEHINETIDRALQIWSQADKEALVKSFGFPGIDDEEAGITFLDWVYQIESLLNLRSAHYAHNSLNRLYETGETEPILDIFKRARILALADLILQAMIVGRERERLRSE